MLEIVCRECSSSQSVIPSMRAIEGLAIITHTYITKAVIETCLQSINTTDDRNQI